MMSSEKFAKPNKRKIVPLPEKEYPNIDFSDEETSQSLELVQGTVSSSDLSPDLSKSTNYYNYLLNISNIYGLAI